MVYRGTYISDIPQFAMVYQIYTTAQGFDVTHAKWYITFILHFAQAYLAKMSKGPLVAMATVVTCFISHLLTHYRLILSFLDVISLVR